jgi:fatty-acyl-CoA synthase
MALPLVQALEQHPGRWQLQRVMVYGNGGAPLSAHVVDRLKAALPQVMVNNGLGSSEAGFMGGGERPADGNGLMVLAPRPDLALIDEEQRLVTAPGGRGILSRSGFTPVGYYGDPDKSGQTFVTIDGRLWVLTGDQARIDDQGRYVLLGRGSQCINSGGEKIFPEEVEEAVRRYAAVQDVLVVGLPDERWGQRVAAVVELAPGASFQVAELDRICRQHLASYKTPRSVFVVDKVQRSPAGKADYRWARDLAQRAGGPLKEEEQ